MSIRTEYAPSSEQPSDVIDWVRRNLETLALALNEGLERARFIELHVEPTRPRNGDVAYADGTDWNPGAGEGFYGYENGAWVKL